MTSRVVTSVRANARGSAALAVGFATALAALIAASSAGVEKATAQATALSGPNVVVVQVDDARVGDVRAMPKTRRLIGRQGTAFKRFFATHPRCCPSRASYLTGQYSHNHGVQSNGAPDGGYSKLDHTETLPVWLQGAGYVTGHIGKYMNGYGAGGDISKPPGWTEWYGALAGSSTAMYGYRLNENGTVVEYGGTRQDYQSDVYADKAVSFINRRSGGPLPFFLSVNPSAPHTEQKKAREVGPQMPRNPRPAMRDFRRYETKRFSRPASFDERNVSDKPSFIRELRRISPSKERVIERRWRSRLESLLAVDDMVGRIVGKLRQEGELGNTVIALVSDNGYFLGEHRIPGKKAKLYEEAVRVPLMIRGPGFPAGASRRQLTGNIDLAPTILDVAGARASGHELDGRSLLPLARSARAGRGRDILLDTGVTGSTAIRTKRFVYMEHRRGEKELYDLRKDPGQLDSRHRSRRYRDVRRELAEYLGWMRRCSGRVCGAGQPKLRLALDYRTRRRAGERCTASGVTARVSGRDARLISAVAFRFAGRLVARDTTAPFEASVPRSRVSRHRSSAFVARAQLSDGRRLTMDERVPRRC